MANGKIKRIFYEKGYGFIKSANQDPDIFFHRSQIKNVPFEQLIEGQEVEFSLKKDIKGTKAVDVMLAGSQFSIRTA